MTHYVAMDSSRAICYKRERTFDKSISTPKLSALQQKVPQVPTSVKNGYHDYCEQRYDIVLIEEDFLNTEQILKEHKSKRHPRVDNESANKTCAC